MRLIDELSEDIFAKDVLGEIVCISLSKEGLKDLMTDYEEEFQIELIESGRKVSEADLMDYFGKKIIVEEQEAGAKYSLYSKA